MKSGDNHATLTLKHRSRNNSNIQSKVMNIAHRYYYESRVREINEGLWDVARDVVNDMPNLREFRSPEARSNALSWNPWCELYNNLMVLGEYTIDRESDVAFVNHIGDSDNIIRESIYDARFVRNFIETYKALSYVMLSINYMMAEYAVIAGAVELLLSANPKLEEHKRLLFGRYVVSDHDTALLLDSVTTVRLKCMYTAGMSYTKFLPNIVLVKYLVNRGVEVPNKLLPHPLYFSNTHLDYSREQGSQTLLALWRAGEYTIARKFLTLFPSNIIQYDLIIPFIFAYAPSDDITTILAPYTGKWTANTISQFYTIIDKALNHSLDLVHIARSFGVSFTTIVVDGDRTPPLTCAYIISIGGTVEYTDRHEQHIL